MLFFKGVEGLMPVSSELGFRQLSPGLSYPELLQHSSDSRFGAPLNGQGQANMQKSETSNTIFLIILVQDNPISNYSRRKGIILKKCFYSGKVFPSHSLYQYIAKQL